jgi:hypothetical protein
MHGHAPERVDGSAAVAEELVVLDPELVALAQLSVKQDVGPFGELARDPGLVEPDGHQWTGLVEDTRLDALLAAISHRPHGNGPDRHGDGPLLADREGGGRVELPVRVRVREVLEQVALGLDAERLEALDGRREQAGPRVRADRRAGGCLGAQGLGGGKGAEHSGNDGLRTGRVRGAGGLRDEVLA